jgi:hypothetical protein
LPEGVVVGGWEFVIAAYSITGVVLVANAWRLVSALRKGPKQGK